MLVAERHARILGSLRETTMASTEDLALVLDVSAETVRRDLVVLEQKGMLTRIRGGATIGTPSPTGEEPAFTERITDLARDAKDRIGCAAAELAIPGQTIVIDVGTTALAVARALPFDFAGTVATCSLLAAIELADRPNLEVLVCGGRVRPGDLALSNSTALGFFTDFYADIAFLGSGGVETTAGLTDYHLDEAAVRRTIIANSAQSYVLADSSKVGRVARHRVTGWKDITGVVTEKELPSALRSAIEKPGGQVIIA